MATKIIKIKGPFLDNMPKEECKKKFYFSIFRGCNTPRLYNRFGKRLHILFGFTLFSRHYFGGITIIYYGKDRHSKTQANY